MKSLTCAHCLAEIAPDAAVLEDGGDGLLAFCCRACQGIYHLIGKEMV